MKIKNNSGVWLFIDDNGKFLCGIQIEKIQRSGNKYYRLLYTKGGGVAKKLFNTLAEAKENMQNAFDSHEWEP